MTYIDVILLAIALAMDCFAVSMSHSMLCDKFRTRDFFVTALLFGLFQGAMPLITFFAGISFADLMNHVTHWIALVILCLLGGKMIYESTGKRKTENGEGTTDRHVSADDAYRLTHILLLAVATSIDAFATGVLFIPCPEVVWQGAAIIALASFILSWAGSIIGFYAGKRFTFNVELLGGLILIAIGLKIFIAHYLI